MSLTKYGREFGNAQLLGNNNDNFRFLSDREKARALGWSDACPVVERLIKPVDEGGRGASEMIKRYGEINFWLGYLMAELHKQGLSDIAFELIKPEPRRDDEPMGTHDDGWVPEQLKYTTFRSPEAYALPRMITQYAALVSEQRKDRLLSALDLLDIVSQQSTNATELALYFAQEVVLNVFETHGKKEAALLFRHLVSNGKLKEDNSKSAFLHIFDVMKEKTPALFVFYEILSDSEKAEARILDLQQLS